MVGKLLGVTSRTVRKWIGGEADISYSAWRLLLERAELAIDVDAELELVRGGRNGGELTMAKVAPRQLVIVNGRRYSCRSAYSAPGDRCGSWPGGPVRDYEFHVEDADELLAATLKPAFEQRESVEFQVGELGSVQPCIVRDMEYQQDDASYPGFRTNFVLVQIGAPR